MRFRCLDASTTQLFYPKNNTSCLITYIGSANSGASPASLSHSDTATGRYDDGVHGNGIVGTINFVELFSLLIDTHCNNSMAHARTDAWGLHAKNDSILA